MSVVARWGREPLAATALVTLGLAISVWMHAEAAALSSIVRTRELQLEHLRSLVAAIDQPSDGEGATRSLRGLFPSHEIVWLETCAGPVLAVVARVEERAE